MGTVERYLDVQSSQLGETRAEKIDLEPTAEVTGSLNEIFRMKLRGKEKYLIMR